MKFDKKGQLRLTKIELIWVDSCGPQDAWRDQDEVDAIRPSKIASCGYLVSESKKHITIANSVSSTGHAGGAIIIPKCAILAEKRRKAGSW